MRTKLAYIRNEKNLPIVAVAWTAPDNDGNVGVGVSVWNRRDPYNKKILHKVAVGRAEARVRKQTDDYDYPYASFLTSRPIRHTGDALIEVRRAILEDLAEFPNLGKTLDKATAQFLMRSEESQVRCCGGCDGAVKHSEEIQFSEEEFHGSEGQPSG